MPKLKYLTTVLPFIVLLAIPHGARAAVLEEEKRIQIDLLLEIFKTRQLSNLIAQNLTQSMLHAISQKYGKIDGAVGNIIFDEAKKIMYEQFILNGKLNDIFYELYDKYYTAEQLKELVRFYQSPTGRRLIAVGDSIQQRSLEEATKHAATFGASAQQRIQERLEKTIEALKKAEQEAIKTESSKR